MEPPSTPSGRSRRRVAVGVGALLACLAAAASAGQAPAPPRPPTSTPQPPAVGDPAPDFPIIDQQNNETSLREVVKKNIVVLVFYIGYT